MVQTERVADRIKVYSRPGGARNLCAHCASTMRTRRSRISAASGVCKFCVFESNSCFYTLTRSRSAACSETVRRMTSKPPLHCVRYMYGICVLCTGRVLYYIVSTLLRTICSARCTLARSSDYRIKRRGREQGHTLREFMLKWRCCIFAFDVPFSKRRMA